MKLPSFPLYPADFFMDTITWELEELGLYNRLLYVEWINGPLENEIKKLAKIAGISPKKFTKIYKIMSTKFIHTADGKLINVKLEEIRMRQSEYINKQREYGRIGANKKRRNSDETV